MSGVGGVAVLPPDSPQVQPHKPSPNNNVLPPKPPHLAAQVQAASFRQKKPPMPSPPLSPTAPHQKMDQEVFFSIDLLRENYLSFILHKKFSYRVLVISHHLYLI